MSSKASTSLPRFASLVSTFVLAGALNAQPVTSEWHAITSMGTVNDIVVTPRLVWAATAGGALRYDREQRQYTRFTRADGLPGNDILSAALDTDGDLWLGTNGHGLTRFLSAQDRLDATFTEFRDLALNDLFVDADRLYVASDLGISLFSIDVGRVQASYRQLGVFPRDAPVAAVLVFDGRLWAATEAGIAWADLEAPNLQDPEAWSTDGGSIGAAADLVTVGDTLYAAAGRSVWRWHSPSASWEIEGRLPGTAVALGLYDGSLVVLTGSSQFYRRVDAGQWRLIPSAGAARALSREGSALWIGTFEGLTVIGDDTPPWLGDPPANHFYDMTLSPSGDLWVASVPNDQTVPPKGVFQFEGTSWRAHDEATGNPSNASVAVEAGNAGQTWVGTWGRGLAVLDSLGDWHRLSQVNSILRGITAPDAPSFVVVSDIERDRHGNMWLANVQAGLAVMDGFPPQQSHLCGQETLGIAPGRNIGKLSIGPDDLKWIGSAQDGVIVFDDGGTPYLDGDERAIVLNTGVDPRLGSDRVTAVFAGETGVVWIGTDSGLNRLSFTYDGETGDLTIHEWRQYGLDEGLLSLTITDIEADSQGTIWVGTKAGLTQLTAAGQLAITHTAANSRLIDDRVESLLFDSAREQLWVGTFDGLTRIQIAPPATAVGAAAIAYPNPLRLSSGTGSRLTFAGLAAGSTVRIYALDGELVRRLDASAAAVALTWDGANARGRLVSTGVFYYVATDPLGRSTRGKIAVIRTG